MEDRQHPAPDAPTTPPPRRRRRWRVLAGGLLLLLTLLTAALYWLTATEGGFRRLWDVAARASAGKLGYGGVSGTLWDGFSVSELKWQDAGTELTLSRAQLAWRPGELWRGQLHVTALRLGHMTLKTAPSTQPSPPPQAPGSLALPLGVRVDSATLDSLTLPAAGVALYGVVLDYRYDGAAHRLVLQRLGSPWGKATAQLSLGAAAPFALAGKLAVDAHFEGRRAQAGATLGGSLLQPSLSAQVNAERVTAELDGRFAPFEKTLYQRVRALTVRMGNIRPETLAEGLPQAEIGLALDAAPTGDEGFAGGLSLVNNSPGPLSAGRLPLALAVAQFRMDDDKLTVSDAFAQLGGSRVGLSGVFAAADFDLRLALSALKLRELHGAAPDEALSGSVRVHGAKLSPDIALDLHSRLASLKAQARWLRSGEPALELSSAHLQAGAGALDLSGRLALAGKGDFALRGKLAQFDPAKLDGRLPVGRLNADFEASGRLDGKPHGKAALRFGSSQLQGAPLSGQLQAGWELERLSQLTARLALGGNTLEAQGAYGAPGDSLKLTLAADNLALLGPAFGGSARVDARLSGVPAKPLFDVKLAAQGLRLPGGVRVGRLSGDGQLAASGDSPFRLDLDGADIAVAGVNIDSVSLDGSGQRQRHAVQTKLRFKWNGQSYDFATALAGGLSDSGEWRGNLNRLELDGKPSLRLLQPVTLRASAGSAELGAGRWRALGADWQLGDSSWNADGTVRTRGQVRALSLSELEAWVKLPVQQTLRFSADWTLALVGGRPQGQLALTRDGGDVTLPGAGGMLGLSQAELRADFAGNTGRATLRVDSRYGKVAAQGSVPLTAPLSAATPLAATLDADLPSLAVLLPWLGPGYDLGGSLTARLAASGPLSAPQLAGTLQGSGLLFVDRRQGVKLERGQLAARFDGRRLLVDSLRFGSGDELVAKGALALDGDAPQARVDVVFKRLRAVDIPGRRITLSGQTALSFDGRQLGLSGALRVDQARLEMPKLGAPALADDVEVVGRAKDESKGTMPVALDLKLDLGEDFRFSGLGLSTALKGKLMLKSGQGGALSIVGQVATEGGRFKAYGQDLDIERGLITFNGASDNPALSVRAVRRQSPVGAGVEVSGTVQNMRLQLVSDEPMSERDRLSWLVLGRPVAGADARDNNALAAAAGGYLAGAVNDKLGLFDDIGLSSREARTSYDGAVSPAEQVVTLGKQLTRELYLGYEYGISSATQAMKVAYQLTRALSLVGKAGTESSVEFRFTKRFD